MELSLPSIVFTVFMAVNDHTDHELMPQDPLTTVGCAFCIETAVAGIV